ncbi:MAG TPA: DUF4157 domain-containing protein [Steroidobacteraceae bacterium]|nr:DUF4157 domain-containing protein [Steroidobacteraceae bacterium]
MARATRGGGTPLEATLRAQMERALGFDFASVRVHSGPDARVSASRLGAQAYTVGRDIVFGAGQFAPHSTSGRRLIAHELVHVMQQRGASAGNARVQCKQPQDPDEVAAAQKEESALTSLAADAIASKRPQIAVQEVLWRLIKAHGLDMHFELSGSRYERKQKGVAVEMHGKGPRTSATLVAGDDALSRVAAGQAAQIAQEIESQISLVRQARGTIDYVFIMGRDKSKANPFYAKAKEYFKAEYPSAVMIEDVRDLEGINARINQEGKPVNDLIIVSHAHADGTLQFSLSPTLGRPGKVEFAALKEANQKHSLVAPDPNLVGSWTNVLIRGCNLGRSEAMLTEVRSAFGGGARVLAPTHEQGYGGGEESMAGPYYEQPGRSSLKDAEALKRLQAKPEYGFVTNWKSMSRHLRREVDATTEGVWSGLWPEKGKELQLLRELLKGQPSPPPLKEFTFGGAQVQGKMTVFTFKAKDKFKFGDFTTDPIETPPTDAEAIQIARDRTARPEAYSFTVRRSRRGLHLSVDVDVARTEWTLYHQDLLKGGKRFHPSPGVRPWFGDTDY